MGPRSSVVDDQNFRGSSLSVRSLPYTSSIEPILVAAVSLIELIYLAEKRSASVDADTLRRLLEMFEEQN